MTALTDTPRVWIADLAAYNAGYLHGEWVDATDADEMHEAGKRIIASTPADFAEELAIHDYDGFGELSSTLGEYPSFETVARVGALIEEHGEAFLAFCETCEPDLETVTEDDFFEAFRGEWDSEEAYAMELVTEIGWSNVPAIVFIDQYGSSRLNVFEELSSYLDWKSIARGLFRHGSYSYQDGYVFESV